MDFLVVSYSRSGNNAALGDLLAERLSCTHERLEAGKIGIFAAGLSSVLGLKRKVQSVPVKDKFVILCTPAWIGRLPAPMRGFLEQHELATYAMASVSGSGKNQQMVKSMVELAGKKPKRVIEFAADTQKIGTVLSHSDVEKRFGAEIDRFVQSL